MWDGQREPRASVRAREYQVVHAKKVNLPSQGYRSPHLDLPAVMRPQILARTAADEALQLLVVCSQQLCVIACAHALTNLLPACATGSIRVSAVSLSGCVSLCLLLQCGAAREAASSEIKPLPTIIPLVRGRRLPWCTIHTQTRKQTPVSAQTLVDRRVCVFARVCVW